MKYLSFFTFALLVLSCQKETTPINFSTTLFPTSVGSYWVYECNHRDANGNITSMNVSDTVEIIGDTLIGGKTYITFEGTTYGYGPYRWYHRDSSGYVIDNFGKIQYSLVNFSDTLHTYVEAGIYKLDWMMKSNNGNPTIVPAGTFTTIDYQGHCRKVSGMPFTGCGNDEYIIHNYYSPSIGLIKANTIFYSQLESSCNDMERVLSSYHIE